MRTLTLHVHTAHLAKPLRGRKGCQVWYNGYFLGSSSSSQYSDQVSSESSTRRCQQVPQSNWIFSSIQFFFLTYPTRSNFVVVMAGSWNNEYIKLKEQYNNKHNTRDVLNMLLKGYDSALRFPFQHLTMSTDCKSASLFSSQLPHGTIYNQTLHCPSL